MMKHPSQNRRRALQARTRAAETNSGGSTPQGIRVGSSDPEQIDLDYDRVNGSGNPNA
jgi:hypothetical protein